MKYPNHFKHSQKGAVLLLTLLMIILMAFEVALVSVVVLRGLGEEGMLISRRIEAENAAQSALTQLHRQLSTEMRDGMSLDELMLEYSLGGASQVALFTNQILQITNPADGTTAATDPPIYISAWIDPDQSRGNYLHLVGRARSGGTDIRLNRFERLNTCTGTGTLTTILTSSNYPGMYSSAVAPDGRVFFGEYTSNSRFWTWKDGVLTTLMASAVLPAAQPARVSEDGRVFFSSWGEGSSNFWSWKDGVLTTIVAGANNIYNTASALAPDGRVFFGEIHNPGNFWTWKDGVLTTIVAGQLGPGAHSAIAAPDGRVYFGEGIAGSLNGSFWTWKDGVLTTIIDTAFGPGRSTRSVAPDGRVFFGEVHATNSSFWTWKDGVLTTILTGGKRPGQYSNEVSPDGRVFFGENNDGQSVNMWTWKLGEGLITIVAAQPDRLGFESITVSEEGRAFFGGWSASAARFWSWKDGVLTTIVPSADRPGSWGVRMTPDERVFFGERGNPGNFWTWKDGVLTTIINDGADVWPTYPEAITPDGRVFIGSDEILWSWKNGQLTTILDGYYWAGDGATVISDYGDAYFSSWDSPGNFWHWEFTPDCSLL